MVSWSALLLLQVAVAPEWFRTLTFWASVASIAGLMGTGISLWLALRTEREAKAERTRAAAARMEAEDLRERYAQRLRLPELAVELERLAGRLTECLINFAESQDEARDLAGEVARAIESAERNIATEGSAEIEALKRTILRNRSVLRLEEGQAVRTAARDGYLYLRHLLADDRARSI